VGCTGADFLLSGPRWMGNGLEKEEGLRQRLSKNQTFSRLPSVMKLMFAERLKGS